MSVETAYPAKQGTIFTDFTSGFTGFSKSPSPDGNSDEYSDSDEDDRKVYKNPVNEAPTKTCPEFRKYGVKDFRFLKVRGKGS